MEPPTEPTPPSSTNPSPESPRRAWTILGRLSDAVREQNWFAVVLEVCIVIVGVVIGFQVTAWGQARSDAAREKALLRQIIVDLEETEATMRLGDSASVAHERTAVNLLQAFYAEKLPPADSVLQWRMDSWGFFGVGPTLESIEALLTGDDRALLRNDALRVALADHLGGSQYWLRTYRDASERRVQADARIGERFDDREVLRWSMSPRQLDSLAAADPLFLLASGQRAAFPFDPEEMVRDREVYNALNTIHQSLRVMRASRRYWRESSVALREQIEASLGP